jgi:hypothetical protein
MLSIDEDILNTLFYPHYEPLGLSKDEFMVEFNAEALNIVVGLALNEVDIETQNSLLDSPETLYESDLKEIIVDHKIEMLNLTINEKNLTLMYAYLPEEIS